MDLIDGRSKSVLILKIDTFFIAKLTVLIYQQAHIHTFA